MSSNTMIHTIIIHQTGTIECLGNPLEIPGKSHSSRWSEIIPVATIPRIAFRLIRRLAGDNGGLAAWTRRWPVMWELRILQGTLKGYTARCNCRQTLIDLEHEHYHLTAGLDL